MLGQRWWVVIAGAGVIFGAGCASEVASDDGAEAQRVIASLEVDDATIEFLALPDGEIAVTEYSPTSRRPVLADYLSRDRATPLELYQALSDRAAPAELVMFQRELLERGEIERIEPRALDAVAGDTSAHRADLRAANWDAYEQEADCRRSEDGAYFDGVATFIEANYKFYVHREATYLESPVRNFSTRFHLHLCNGGGSSPIHMVRGTGAAYLNVNVEPYHRSVYFQWTGATNVHTAARSLNPRTLALGMTGR